MKKANIIVHAPSEDIELTETWYIVQYREEDSFGIAGNEKKSKNDDFVDSKEEADKLKADWENE